MWYKFEVTDKDTGEVSLITRNKLHPDDYGFYMDAQVAYDEFINRLERSMSKATKLFDNLKVAMKFPKHAYTVRDGELLHVDITVEIDNGTRGSIYVFHNKNFELHCPFNLKTGSVEYFLAKCDLHETSDKALEAHVAFLKEEFEKSLKNVS